MTKDEKGSFADPESLQPQGSPTPSDTTAPLFAKLDSISAATNRVADILVEISTSLKKLAACCTLPAPVVTQKPVTKPTTTTSTQKREEKKAEAIPEALQISSEAQDILEHFEPLDRDLLDIDETTSEDYFIIRPKRFLGDQWGGVTRIVADMDGKWIKDGKASHWQVPKGQ